MLRTHNSSGLHVEANIVSRYLPIVWVFNIEPIIIVEDFVAKNFGVTYIFSINAVFCIVVYNVPSNTNIYAIKTHPPIIVIDIISASNIDILAVP